MKGGKKYFTILALLMVFILAGKARASLRIEQVKYKLGATTFYGHLVYDDSSKVKRPGVLVVHEWWGLEDHAKKKAEALAEAGYIALALDMYGEGKITEHPKEAGEWSGFIRQNRRIGKERFMAAYELLKNHELTEGGKIAAIGYCFGGHVVLSMALEDIPLRGVVSFHGALPIERAEPTTIKAKILVCHGADDSFITQDQIRQFQENLKYAGADWQFIVYGGAKHSFTNPGADKRGIPALAYSSSADKRSWDAMLTFFKEIFAD
jgi:dienelactone hydrolase